MRELQEAFKPFLIFMAKIFNTLPILTTAQHSTEYEHQNSYQFMSLITGTTSRIWQVNKVGLGIR